MYGRTKSGRKNVKQVQFGIDVARDGAVPIDLIPFDGNEAEVKTHVENMDRLRRMLPKGKLVYTAGTKFDAPENLLANKALGAASVLPGTCNFRRVSRGEFTIDGFRNRDLCLLLYGQFEDTVERLIKKIPHTQRYELAAA